MKKTPLVLFALFALLIWVLLARASCLYRIRPAVVDAFKLPLTISAKSIEAIYNLSVFQNRYEKNILMLEKKIAILTKMAVEKKEILGENQRLRALLLFKTRIGSKGVAGEVIGRGVSNLDSFIIIDKGSADGIIPKMSVAKEEGLVGRVLEVGRGASKVILIDNPNSRIGAVIQRTREQGALVGLGGGLCKMIYLAHNTDAKPGDIVVASQLSSISPKGMLIGEVEKVVKNPFSLYASAIVRPFCNLFRIEEVLCIEE